MNGVDLMIYIEKNDKPNIIEKMLNLIKVQDSTIILPINEKTKEKQIEKNTEDISIIKDLIKENPELFKKFMEKKKEKELTM